MPLPLASLIPAAASIASTGVNAVTQGNMNRSNRRFQREMFDKTNEYNTPLNQVKRFQEAGLNPAMMYQGAPQNTASQVNAVKGEAYKIPENLLADVYQKISQGQLAESKTVPVTINIDSAKANVANTQADTQLKTMNAEKVKSETDLLKQKFQLESDFMQNSKDFRTMALRKLDEEVKILEETMRVLPEVNQKKIDLLAQQYLQSRASTRKLTDEAWVLENEQQLRDAGINPNGNNLGDTILRYLYTLGAKAFEKDKTIKQH